MWGSTHRDQITSCGTSPYLASFHSSIISNFLSVFVSLLFITLSPSLPLCPLYPFNPLILRSSPRWGGLALAWLFHSLLITVPPPPVSPDLHTSWTGTSPRLVFPLAFTQWAVPRAPVPPWTHHRPRWPWTREAYAFAHTPPRSK